MRRQAATGAALACLMGGALLGCSRGGGAGADEPRMADGYWREVVTREGHTDTLQICVRHHSVLPLAFARCEEHGFTRPAVNVIKFHMKCRYGSRPDAYTQSDGVITGDLNTAWRTEQAMMSPPATHAQIASVATFTRLSAQCPPGGEPQS